MEHDRTEIETVNPPSAYSMYSCPHAPLVPSSEPERERVFGGPYMPIATLQDALADPPRVPKPHSPPSAEWSYDNQTVYDSHSVRPAVQFASAGPLARTPQQQRKKFSRGLNRFRDRLQQLEERLKLDVNGLRQDIRDLELRKAIMETRTLATRFCGMGSAAKLVREYFAIFRNGFQVLPRYRDLHGNSSSWTTYHMISSSSHDQDAITQLLVSQLELARKQNAFLDAMVDPDMGFRSFTGRHVLRDQLERYARCHAGLRMELLTLETSQRSGVDAEDAATVVCTRGRLTAYITQETLENIFPVVLRQPLLCKRLLGSFIAYPFRVEFHVSPGGKITKYDGDVDFVAALSEVLGSLEDVTTVIRHALISEFCMIGHLDNDDADCEIRQVEHRASQQVELESIATSSSSITQQKQTTESPCASNQQKAALTYILS
uniref:BZIP domain-containing protein n=1 Tax=Globisporangium ultimum (strain ATCC 200006 / CBS 805.95 / DAOM BR144) TaxID=431595 RepID=K3WC19_GLOUD